MDKVDFVMLLSLQLLDLNNYIFNAFLTSFIPGLSSLLPSLEEEEELYWATHKMH